MSNGSLIFDHLLYFHVFAGDLPYEAHVQTHGGGAPSEPPVAPEDRVPQHPHTHLPHLSSPRPLSSRSESESTFGWSL